MLSGTCSTLPFNVSKLSRSCKRLGCCTYSRNLQPSICISSSLGRLASTASVALTCAWSQRTGWDLLNCFPFHMSLLIFFILVKIFKIDHFTIAWDLYFRIFAHSGFQGICLPSCSRNIFNCHRAGLALHASALLVEFDSVKLRS